METRARSSSSARFYEQHRDEFLDFGGAYDVQLAKPAMKAGFETAVAALASDPEEPPLFGPARFSDRHDTLRTPVGIETVALLGLGFALSVAGIVAVGLVLRAEQRTHEREVVTLRALGFTRARLGLTSVLRSLPLALGGALLAVGVAIALSGRYPVGIGRQVELDPGVQVDAAVLLVGAIVILVSTLGIAYLLGRSNRSRPDVRRGRATLAKLCAQVGAPVDVTVGANLAFEHGRGARSTPTRLAILGGAAALAVVTALVFLVGGIDHLYADRPAHGWPWDVAIGNTNFTLSDQTVATLTHDRRIHASTVARYGQAAVDDVQTELLAVDVKGTAPPELVSGRLPASDSEIALGRAPAPPHRRASRRLGRALDRGWRLRRRRTRERPRPHCRRRGARADLRREGRR